MAWIGYRFVINAGRQNALRIAATVFRNSIGPDIFKGLRGHQLHTALIQTFPVFKSAVHEYEVHIGVIARFRLKRAWNEYCGGDEDNQDFLEYYIKDHGPDLLVERLEKLRSFGNKR